MDDQTKKAAQPPKAVVVDLGRQTRKRVKALRKGEGSLLADVHTAIEQLRQDGVIGASVQPVIVVVERKLSANLLPSLFR